MMHATREKNMRCIYRDFPAETGPTGVIHPHSQAGIHKETGYGYKRLVVTFRLDPQGSGELCSLPSNIDLTLRDGGCTRE